MTDHSDLQDVDTPEIDDTGGDDDWTGRTHPHRDTHSPTTTNPIDNATRPRHATAGLRLAGQRRPGVAVGLPPEGNGGASMVVSDCLLAGLKELPKARSTGTALAGCAHGAVSWVHNARAAGRVSLALRGDRLRSGRGFCGRGRPLTDRRDQRDHPDLPLQERGPVHLDRITDAQAGPATGSPWDRAWQDHAPARSHGIGPRRGI